MPRAHHLISIGLFILQFQERLSCELLYHIIEHIFSDIFIREMLPDAVELVLQRNIDVGFYQYLLGLKTITGTECLVVCLEQIENVNPIISPQYLLL